MDKIKKYRQTIIEILNNYKEILNRRENPPIESFFIFDEQNDNYTWLKFGWQDGSRVETITAFIRIIDGKIYIEEDLTERGIAADLMEKGISPKEIVLAFQKPEKRKLTEFALN